MELPEPYELNIFNQILFNISRLIDKSNECSLESLLNSCSLMVFGGRVINYKKIIDKCRYSGFIKLNNKRVRTTPLANQFLLLNTNRTFEINASQKEFIVDNLYICGPWKAETQNLFSNFYSNNIKVTFELDIINNPLPVKYNRIINNFLFLEVISNSQGLLSVLPNYVSKIVQLRCQNNKLTEENFNKILEANRKLADLTEDAVVEYERKRLRNIGRELEANLVRKISKLDVAAGYDVISFDGDLPQVEHNRFIEVKSSTETKIRFFWSLNERETAIRLGNKYWIYFIGDFQQNNKSINPIMIQDPVKSLTAIPNISIQPCQYLINQIT